MIRQMTDILKFPGENKRRSPLSVENIEIIGFVTKDDRDLYIDDPAGIAKIIALIKREKIKILEDD